jgi:hypothetical protein
MQAVTRLFFWFKGDLFTGIDFEAPHGEMAYLMIQAEYRRSTGGEHADPQRSQMGDIRSECG